ncbi:pentapeptide repeat-containing protein [Calothrix rhizosoleniae]|uniref:pentapeptide repeat-containing protein n=1 Tax=Calothrix rhizosoleniae TaxID=888997 RepID=UPI001F45EC6C|nr:pentapeptide repeat-containing protein [Calothrix rhizosoleniae]
MIKLTWITRKLREKLRGLLDIVWFRVLLAIVIAYFLMLTFSHIEQWNKQMPVCQSQDSLLQCFYKQALSVIELNNIESFSILAAATLYLLESRERRRNTIYEAWQVIDNAAAANVATSYARIKALKDLNNYGVSLKALDVPSADLNGIDLAGADLSIANLSNANLTYANLKGANLSDAQLEGANLCRAILKEANLQFANLSDAQLEGANLCHADLSNTDLGGANLGGADLRGAILEFADLNGVQLEVANLTGAKLAGAQLEGADLSDAKLEGVNLQQAYLLHANLTYADLRNADFRGVQDLCIEQIQAANNWERARYDPSFCEQLGLPVESKNSPRHNCIDIVDVKKLGS